MAPDKKDKKDKKKEKPLHADHRARMQDRVRREGLPSLAAHEALEYLLYFAITRQDTNPIAHRLLQRFGSYCNVLDASEEELCKVEGVGPASARLIASLRKFEQYYQLQKRKGRTRPLRTEADRIEYVSALFLTEQEERCYLVAMNDQCLPLREVLVSQGAPNHVGINSRKLAREAVASGCTCAYLAHNHPSGIAVPSRSDLLATAQVEQLLGTLGVHLLDHIIVAPDSAASMMRQYRSAGGDRRPAVGSTELLLASEPILLLDGEEDPPRPEPPQP